MDNLGQIKALLEWQSIRSLTGGQPSNTSPFSSGFSDLLQTFMESAAPPPSAGSVANPMNMLGQLYSSQMKNISYMPVQQLLPDPVQPAPLSSQSAPVGSLEDVINKAAAANKVPAKLLKSIIRHESNFNPKAVSHAGASGLMQLMPATARGLGVTNIFDPEQNVMAGAKFIKSMLDKYNGNLKLALAAYNAGPGNVDKYGGIPPFKETQSYVRKVSDTFYS